MDFKETKPWNLPQVNFQSAERTSPDFIFQATMAVFLLTACSAFAGIIIGLLFAAGAGASVRVAWICGAVAGAIGYMTIGLQWHKIVFRRESVKGNEPERLEPAPLMPETATWVLYDHNGKSPRMGEFSVPPDLLTAWCEAGLRRQSLSFAAWVPWFSRAFAKEGRVRFEKFRREWTVKEYGEDKGGNVGMTFTEQGDLFAERWIARQPQLADGDTPPPELLEAGDVQG